MSTRVEINCATGVETTHELTAEEIADRAAYQAVSEAADAAEAVADKARSDAATAGKSKLAALGLTDEEIAALVG
jgi:hypothetical protein|tara:strand:- start:6 stop:230 length:225 start_codon:yes stop_codon:yes gene_type:complete